MLGELCVCEYCSICPDFSAIELRKLIPYDVCILYNVYALWHCGHSLFNTGNASTIYMCDLRLLLLLQLLLLPLLSMFIRVVISPFVEVEKHTVCSKTAIYVESFIHLFIHSFSLSDDTQHSLTLIVAETNPPIYDECSFPHHRFICQILNAMWALHLSSAQPHFIRMMPWVFFSSSVIMYAQFWKVNGMSEAEVKMYHLWQVWLYNIVHKSSAHNQMCEHNTRSSLTLCQFYFI